MCEGHSDTGPVRAAALEVKHRESLQLQQQELRRIGQPDTMMPQASSDNFVACSLRLTEPLMDPVKVEDDEYQQGKTS